MKYLFSFILAFIVAVVAFGGWYGGIDSSKVEAGFAPLEIAGTVIGMPAANIVVGVVETTTSAENLAIESIRNRQIAKVEFAALYTTGPLAVIRTYDNTMFDWPARMTLGENDNYTKYNRVCASRSTISRTMRYRA